MRMTIRCRDGLFLPELSHLSRACATVYTDSYVRWLAEVTPRIKLRTDAPNALRRSDCPPSAEAIAVQKIVEGAKPDRLM